MPRTMYAANAKMYTVASPRPAVSVPFLDPNAAYSHINKMIASGAVESSVEMACLEWVRTAAAPEFKLVQRLIK